MENKINLGLKGKLNHNIIESVFGQLSDGMWENSPGMCKWWRGTKTYLNENDEVILEFSGCLSGFAGMSEKDVRKKFAGWIKRLVKDEFDGLTNWRNIAGSRLSDYLGYPLQVTVADAREAYDTLLGRR